MSKRKYLIKLSFLCVRYLLHVIEASVTLEWITSIIAETRDAINIKSSLISNAHTLPLKGTVAQD